MCEVALEALVHHVKTFTLLHHTMFAVRLQAKLSERKVCL